MAISLNSHESRIKTLEGKIGAGFSDTGWINGTPIKISKHDYGRNLILRYRIVNNVAFLHLCGYVSTFTFNDIIGTLPNWRYGEVYFGYSGGGDAGGEYESNSFRVDVNGNIRYNVPGMSQYAFVPENVASCPLTI